MFTCIRTVSFPKTWQNIELNSGQVRDEKLRCPVGPLVPFFQIPHKPNSVKQGALFLQGYSGSEIRVSVSEIS